MDGAFECKYPLRATASTRSVLGPQVAVGTKGSLTRQWLRLQAADGRLAAHFRMALYCRSLGWARLACACAVGVNKCESLRLKTLGERLRHRAPPWGRLCFPASWIMKSCYGSRCPSHGENARRVFVSMGGTCSNRQEAFPQGLQHCQSLL